jgi:antitoxin component HigA of HigAB toxin-antitoxin module
MATRKTSKRQLACPQELRELKLPTKPVRTQDEHVEALAAIDLLWNAEPGTKEGDALELWTTLTLTYENENMPMLLPDPIEAIKFRLEQQGLSTGPQKKVTR